MITYLDPRSRVSLSVYIHPCLNIILTFKESREMTTVISHLNMDSIFHLTLVCRGMDEMYHSLQFMALRVNFIRIGPV